MHGQAMSSPGNNADVPIDLVSITPSPSPEKTPSKPSLKTSRPLCADARELEGYGTPRPSKSAKLVTLPSSLPRKSSTAFVSGIKPIQHDERCWWEWKLATCAKVSHEEAKGVLRAQNWNVDGAQPHQFEPNDFVFHFCHKGC